MDKNQEETIAKHTALIKQRRDQVAEGLQQMLDALEEGHVRTIAVVAVMKNGRDFVTLHVEDGSSNAEVFGIAHSLQALVDQAKATPASAH